MRSQPSSCSSPVLAFCPRARLGGRGFPRRLLPRPQTRAGQRRMQHGAGIAEIEHVLHRLRHHVWIISLQRCSNDLDQNLDLRLVHLCADIGQLAHLGHQPAQLAQGQWRHGPIPAAHRDHHSGDHSTVLR